MLFSIFYLFWRAQPSPALPGWPRYAQRPVDARVTALRNVLARTLAYRFRVHDAAASSFSLSPWFHLRCSCTRYYVSLVAILIGQFYFCWISRALICPRQGYRARYPVKRVTNLARATIIITRVQEGFKAPLLSLLLPTAGECVFRA